MKIIYISLLLYSFSINIYCQPGLVSPKKNFIFSRDTSHFYLFNGTPSFHPLHLFSSYDLKDSITNIQIYDKKYKLIYEINIIEILSDNYRSNNNRFQYILSIDSLKYGNYIFYLDNNQNREINCVYYNCQRITHNNLIYKGKIEYSKSIRKCRLKHFFRKFKRYE